MQRKFLPLVVVLVAGSVLIAAGCGGGSTASEQGGTGSGTAAEQSGAGGSGESFDRSNWALLNSDPDAHKGASVDFVGKVFTTPERDADGTYLQVWADPENSEWNTIVGIHDPNFQVSDGDYVHVVGTVKGKFTGQNAFGADVTTPTVIADTVEVVDALAAAPPALATLGRGTFTQAGIAVTVRKVEFAASETRVLLTVKNNSGDSVTVFSSSMKAVQGGRQFDSTFSTADYPELSSDLLAGAKTSGVVVFPKMNPNAGLKLVVEISSNNFDVGDYGKLTYTFTWK